MKRTIEIEDKLEAYVDNATSQITDLIREWCEANDADECPDLSNDLDYSGRVHEIIDGSVPIWTSEINDAFYLHGNEIESAFDDAGIGEKNDDSWPMGWKAAAIYCYIEQEVNSWYRLSAEDIFDEWQKSRESKAKGA